MYKSYPIFDLRVGKVTAVEPWLLPKDAFETLRNCHLKRGVLEKRKGYEEFGRIIHINTATGVPTAPGNTVMGISDYYTGVTKLLIAMDTKRVNRYISGSGMQRTITAITTANAGSRINVESVEHGFLTGDVVLIAGTTNYDGLYSIEKIDDDNFECAVAYVADETGTATEEVLKDVTTLRLRFKTGQNNGFTAGNTLVGAGSAATAIIDAVDIQVGTFAGSDASGTLHLSSQTGTFTIGENLEISTDVGTTRGVNNEGGDSSDSKFTGDDTDFFSVQNWRGYGYITNNHDQIQRYTSNNRLVRFNIDLEDEGGPNNNVNTCLLMFVIKSHLVLFRTGERISSHYQRARWSEVNTPTIFKDDNYLDAPTEDWIITGGFIGDDLIIEFEHSTWRFSYTSDPDLPFRWDRLDNTEGCSATHSAVAFEDKLISVSATNIIATDGRDVKEIDAKIPDFMLEWALDKIGYSYSFLVKEESQILISYASASASKPDSALVINTDDNSFATYGLPIHVLGKTAIEETISTDDMIGISLDDLDYSLDDKELRAGYPIILMGCRTGYIYKLNTGGSDDGSAIEFSAIGGRWNPFVEEGRRARLGWIDFLVDRDDDVSFDVESFINSEADSYQTKTVTCTETGTARNKVLKRVYCNSEADFHRIDIGNNASANRPRIHAIIPYFDRGGRMI